MNIIIQDNMDYPYIYIYIYIIKTLNEVEVRLGLFEP